MREIPELVRLRVAASVLPQEQGPTSDRKTLGVPLFLPEAGRGSQLWTWSERQLHLGAGGPESPPRLSELPACCTFSRAEGGEVGRTFCIC